MQDEMWKVSCSGQKCHVLKFLFIVVSAIYTVQAGLHKSFQPTEQLLIFKIKNQKTKKNPKKQKTKMRVWMLPVNLNLRSGTSEQTSTRLSAVQSTVLTNRDYSHSSELNTLSGKPTNYNVQFQADIMSQNHFKSVHKLQTPLSQVSSQKARVLDYLILL